MINNESCLSLKDYMLRGGAKSHAFVSRYGPVYIVKDIGRTLADSSVLEIKAEIITAKGRVKSGFPLGGSHSCLGDRKATYREIRDARYPKLL